MKENLKLFLNGFVIGFGKIMPGVSGSVMAICLGIYERLIACFSSLHNLKKDFNFFIFVTIGICIAIIFGSNIIKFFIDNYYLYTISFFIGMMVPGIIPLFKEIKKEEITFRRLMISLCTFFLLMTSHLLTFSNKSLQNVGLLKGWLSLFLCGIIDAGSSIIPGISGSAILMILGYYDEIITSLSNPFRYAFVLIPFMMGVVLGIILISRLITYLFKHHRVITYMLIITFSSFSVLTLLESSLKFITRPLEAVLYIIALLGGFYLSKKIEQIFKVH